MAKRMRRGHRSIVRNASKSMEKNMLQQAKLLYNDPYIVLPKYEDAFSTKRFKKIRKQIEKIIQIKDDVARLEKASNKKNLSAAIAGTLLVHHAKKAPFLAAAPLSSGSALYAQRGNATKEFLIAVQNTDDPLLRLLAIKDTALKYGLHIYSWNHSFISTGEQANPPDDFIAFVMKKNELHFEKKLATCDHLSSSDLQNKKLIKNPYLHIYWKSADTTIGICQQCSQNNKNTIYELTKYMIEPNLAKDFQINVIGKVIKEETTDETYETSFIDEYLSGKLFDKQMIQKNMNNRLTDLKESEDISYVLNGNSYDHNIESFVEALHPNKYEKKALISLLNKHNRSVVVDNVTPNAVIELLWDEHGLSLLEEIISESNKAKDLFSLSDAPSQIIKLAYEMQKHKEILRNLPIYEKLPPIASFANHIGRVYRTDGKEKLIIEAKKHPENTQGKAIYYAFLLVVDKALDVKWKFKKDEVESGEFLKPYAEKFLHCSPEEYHDALQDFLKYSGTTIDLIKYKK